jgi:MFS family permease
MTSTRFTETAPAASKLRVPVGVIIAIACVGQFLLVLNTTIINVALPGMHAALGLSVDGQQWVVNGYLVSSGAGVVHGYRTAFAISAAVSLASAIIAAFLPARTLTDSRLSHERQSPK